MSILIRGMRFPKTCDECLINCGHSMLYINITDRRSPYCPLIELPPHGRLIDADELASKTFYGKTSAPYITYRTFMNAPTVIEAEGSES